jgi:hypothetical protein
MLAKEMYRYFWIKVSDEAARAASAQAALELQTRLANQLKSAGPQSPEESLLRTEQDMARWYLGGEIMKGTKIVIVSPPNDAPSLDVLAAAGQAVLTGTFEISIAVMPPAYPEDMSRDWLYSPVGQAWGIGAVACRLSYAVVGAANTV